MAANTVISMRGLGKRYDLGVTFLAKSTLRDTLGCRVKRLLHRRSDDPKDAEKEFWALKAISFDVAEGEVVGIIGHNGAGKSTLLKILSGITEPTAGEIRMRGRVGALLEVGTGFHQELTGRENIFMNGAILGMGQSEIRRKFDEIVAFAGVERFLDMPVKRYSSGMLIRLGFAVAAHLEPELLIVDEVLAVGDLDFQRKCLGKIDDISRSGRTVLFVSHNLTAVEGLCSRCILLAEGAVIADGVTSSVLGLYHGQNPNVRTSAMVDLANLPGRKSVGPSALDTLEFLDSHGLPCSAVKVGGDVTLRMLGKPGIPSVGSTINILIKNGNGQRITTLHSAYQSGRVFDFEGRFVVSCEFMNCRLMPGVYYLDIIFRSASGLTSEYPRVPLEVHSSDLFGTGKLLPPRSGSFLAEGKWSVGRPGELESCGSEARHRGHKTPRSPKGQTASA